MLRTEMIHSTIRLSILAVIAVMLFSASGCATFFRADDPWFGRDKAYHFAAGGVIGAGTTLAVKNSGVHRDTAPCIGIAASVAIGGGKEWYDANIKRTYWSWKDMVWDLAGGTAGSYIAIQK
jgi:putative lipoprotein